MIKVDPVLTIPSTEEDLDFAKQKVFNSHLGRSLTEYSAILSTRVNKLLPKDGSEAFTGDLAIAGSLAVVGSAVIGGTLAVGSNLTPVGAVGSVVGSAFVSYATNTNLTTILPGDDTIPTITEGTEILTQTYTPKSVLNKMRCRFQGHGTTAANTYSLVAAIYQGSTCIGYALIFPSVANQVLAVTLEAEYTPGVLTAQTISVRVGPSAAGTIRMNGTTAARFGGGIALSTLVVEEIKG